MPSSSRLSFFFLMIRRPPRSTPFPTRRSSDLSSFSFSTGHSQEDPPGLLFWDSRLDRKSTRLNSSHSQISYAVFFSTKFFFFNDTATPEIYTFPYTTLFRSIFFFIFHRAFSRKSAWSIVLG